MTLIAEHHLVARLRVDHVPKRVTERRRKPNTTLLRKYSSRAILGRDVLVVAGSGALLM